MTLTEVFGNADLLRENNMFDSLLKGLTIQPCQRFDNTFANSVSPAFYYSVSTARKYSDHLKFGRSNIGTIQFSEE
jgi:hypothetical protein